MKLLRIAAAMVVAAWLVRKFVELAREQARHMREQSALHREHGRRISHWRGSHLSAASAANGTYWDDRDVVGVGALRDEEVAAR